MKTKRFVIPAFIVVDTCEDKDWAEAKASALMKDTITSGLAAEEPVTLLFDEELPTVEIPVEEELPHSFKDCLCITDKVTL